MGILRRTLDRLLDTGMADDPRRVRVESKISAVDVPLQSASGAPVRVERSGKSGEIGRFLLWAHRRGVAMELVEGGMDQILVGGTAFSPARAREKLSLSGAKAGRP